MSMDMHAHDLVSHLPRPKPKACVCVHKDQYDTDTVPASWHQLRSVINPVILHCSSILFLELSRHVASCSMLFIRQPKRSCFSPCVDRSAPLRKQNQAKRPRASGLRKASLPQMNQHQLKQQQQRRHTAHRSSHRRRRK